MAFLFILKYYTLDILHYINYIDPTLLRNVPNEIENAHKLQNVLYSGAQLGIKHCHICLWSKQLNQGRNNKTAQSYA